MKTFSKTSKYTNVILSRLGHLIKSLLNLQSCFLGYELEPSVGILKNLRADINNTTFYKHVVKARPSQPNELLVFIFINSLLLFDSR